VSDPGWDDLDLPSAGRDRRRRRRRCLRRVRRLRVLAVASLVVLAGAGVGVLVVVAHAPGLNIGCHARLDQPRVFGRDSFVYAADGSLLGVVPTSHNREPVPLSRMSPWLPRATVAIEDRRFWRHGALDYRAILRAALADLRAGRFVQGRRSPNSSCATATSAAGA
jgi:penicillin-binding protein 1A